MKLSDFLDERLTWVLEKPGDRDQLLRDLCDRMAATVEGIDPRRMYDALLERESQGSTATPEGVAFPHAMLEELETSRLGVALLRPGVDFHGERTPVCDLVFLLIGPPERAWEHLRILARIARLCHGPGALDRFRATPDAAELYQALMEEDGRHV